MAFKIAHLGDLHLGYKHLPNDASNGQNQRMVDYELAAMEIADHLIEEQVDVVVIAGDFLNSFNLYPAPLSGPVFFIDKLNKADIKVLAIGGNHDEAEAENRENALKFLARHHNLDLYLEQTHLDIDNTRFHFVSYRILSRSQRGRGGIEPFEMNLDKTNILVTHGYAPGEGVPEIPEETETIIPDSWLTNKFELCLLGHVHHHGEISKNVFYSGSIERKNFGEVAEQPGFYIHTVNDDKTTESKSILLKDISETLPRPMASFEIDTSQMTPHEVNIKVLRMIKKIEPGAMTRIVLGNVSEELDRAKYKKEWERAHDAAGGLYFESKIQTRRVSELLNVEFAKPPADVGKGLMEYVKAQDLPRKEKVASIAAQVIAEAQEAVLAAEGE